MEAMSMGKAIVSTTSGVNGLDLTPGLECIVENNPARMATEIENLMNDPPRRSELGRRARLAAESRDSWDVIAAAQREMYLELLKS
jgi:glycosyltransferase involved in cell wall biosynthesis